MPSQTTCDLGRSRGGFLTSTLNVHSWDLKSLAFQAVRPERLIEKCRKEPIPTNPAMSRCPYPGGRRSNPTSEAPAPLARPCQPRGGDRPGKDGFRLNASEGLYKAP